MVTPEDCKSSASRHCWFDSSLIHHIEVFYDEYSVAWEWRYPNPLAGNGSLLAVEYFDMGAVEGYGGALQVPCLDRFDTDGLHQVQVQVDRTGIYREQFVRDVRSSKSLMLLYGLCTGVQLILARSI